MRGKIRTVLGSIHSQYFCTRNIPCSFPSGLLPTTTTLLIFFFFSLFTPSYGSTEDRKAKHHIGIARLSLPCSAQPKPFPVILLFLKSPLLFMDISNHLLFPSPKPVKWDQFSCMGLSTNNFHFRTPSLTGSQNLPGSSLLAAQRSCGMKTQKALHLPFLMHEYISESQIKQRGWDRRFIHQSAAAPTTAASQVVIWSPWSGVLKKKSSSKDIDLVMFLFDHSFQWRQIILNVIIISED